MKAVPTFVSEVFSMNATQSLRIFELLNEQFQKPEKARALTEAIEAVIDEKVSTGVDNHKSLLSKDLELLRQENNLNIEKLRVEMREMKSEVIRWQFGFWITIVLLIVAHFFFKK